MGEAGEEEVGRGGAQCEGELEGEQEEQGEEGDTGHHMISHHPPTTADLCSRPYLYSADKISTQFRNDALMQFYTKDDIFCIPKYFRISLSRPLGRKH